MGLRTLLLDILGMGHEPEVERPPCRLTEEEVYRIAEAAMERPARRLARPIKTSAGVEWHVGSATIDGGKRVRIDDATGAVIEIVWFNGRAKRMSAGER